MTNCVLKTTLFTKIAANLTTKAPDENLWARGMGEMYLIILLKYFREFSCDLNFKFLLFIQLVFKT